MLVLCLLASWRVQAKRMMCGLASHSTLHATSKHSQLHPQIYTPQRHDWDALAREVGKEREEEKDGANALFQQIYANASEEMQRAMIKSYTESNGTCLSTNWEEIGKGRVPVTPPEGMEAKPFQQ
jgi:hypothetical protein